MPIKKLQGQSGDATEIKQRGLSFAFRVGLAVLKKSFNKYPYFHFDLHAGSGYNDDAACIGSPLAFLSEVRFAACDNYFAGFCDKDEKQVRALLQRPELDHSRCRIFHGDNAEFLQMIPRVITHHNERLHYATGSVLSDPNGAAVPIEELAWLAETCPRIDVILHWNSTIVKRLRNGIKPDQISLTDAIKQIRKSHWLIREPVGIHQFTMLIGRNHRFNDWRAMGFNHLDSPVGQNIFERCSLSKREIDKLQMQAQGGLFHSGD
jgi:hypothetical protein